MHQHTTATDHHGPTHPTAGQAGHQAAQTTPRQQNRPCITLATTGQPHIHKRRSQSRANQCRQQRNPDKPTACAYNDGERTQRAGHTPVAAQRTPHLTCRPRQDPDHNHSPYRAARTRTFARRTQLHTRRLHDSPRSDRTRQRRRQQSRPNNEQADHKAANTTMHQPNCCSNNDATIITPHASRPTPNQPGMQGSKQERRPTGC